MTSTDWLALAPIVGAVCMTALRTYDRWAHRRAIMNATPDQRIALEKMPVPSPLLDRAGPAILLFAFGASLTAWIHVQSFIATKGSELLPPTWIYQELNLTQLGDFSVDKRRKGLPVYSKN